MAGKSMKRIGKTWKALLATVCVMAIWGCVQHQPETSSAMNSGSKTAKSQQKAMSSDEQILLEAQGTAALQNTDCAKCHDSQPADIMNNGGKHKTAVGCLDCHLEHLPLGKDTIPQCSMCHDAGEREHFALGETPVCLSCHRNPHTPLDVTVDDVPEVSTACKTCHSDKGEEFAAFPSKHAEQNCTLCHPDKHKQIYKCFECHEGHADFMVFEDCLRCHQPHSPLNIHYADDTPSKFCGACHADLYESLTKNQSKHNALNCAYCHQDKHPTVPNCRDCHDQPHSASLLSNFNEDCLKCHRNPHDLIY